MTITETLSAWIPQVQGRYLNEDWNPTNKGFGAQCWDVPASWSKHLGLPVISTGGRGRWPGWAGNMVDAFPQTTAIAAAYELHGPGEYVNPGDILVWDDSYPAWFPKTHVAVAVRDFGAQILTVSQNSTASQPGNPYPEWTTGPTTIQHLPRRGLLGIIRPRTGINSQGTITPQEDELSAQDVEALQIINNENADRVILDNRAQIRALGDELVKKINDESYEMQLWDQKTDNETGDRIINALRADIGAMSPSTIASLIPVGIAKQVADELAKRLVK